MTLLIQHGFGKSDKLSFLSTKPGVSGVILSAGDEYSAALNATRANCGSTGLLTLLDPQSYIYSLAPQGLARFHASNGVEFRSMHWSENAKAVSAQVAAVKRANEAIGIDGLMIAPSCLQSSFADVWTPLSLQFARTAADDWGPHRTIATVAIDERALDDWSLVADWLDVATSVDVSGFYFVVARQRVYPPAPWQPTRLANLLRVFYTLSQLNGYTVTWGYSDIDGLLGLAAGAESISSGWHYTLRTFSPSKWQPTSGGGRPPAARIYLDSLWNAVRAADEARDIYSSSARADIFSADLLRRFSDRSFDSWTRVESQLQHLELLGSRSERLVSLADITDRVDEIQVSMSRARSLLSNLSNEGLALSAVYHSRLNSYAEALTLFCDAENL